MAKKILINSTPQETRIALVEDGRISEIFLERNADKGIVGNIYKGKVVRVLPGMQAAFVDIGHERAAFLYAGDFVPTQAKGEDADFGEEEPGRRRRRSSEEIPPIAELVKPGQEILCQVAKGPLGTKGARLTCHISLPGRFLVFMPGLKHNGVSRKIESYDARKKLKKLMDQHRSKEGGFIVRTAAAGDGIEAKLLKADVEYLLSLWQKVHRKYKNSGAPKLLHYDLDLTTRMIRDHLDEEIDFMIVDSAIEHKKVLRFLKSFQPELKNKVEFYQDPIPLFDRFHVEAEIQRALNKRVWLKSGGYLIIESTEALSTIDVNTGRFVGKKNLEETILRTNLEAAEEIVRQLRLRNMGGIIIIDFIDMEKESSKEQVYRHLEQLVRDDKQKTTILKISNLGLIEMTRKRSREPLHRFLTKTCPTCDGRAFVKNPVSLAHQALRDLRRELPGISADYVHLGVHPEVFQILNGPENQALMALEKNFQKGIKLHSEASFHYEQISINPSTESKPKLGPPPCLQLEALDKIVTAEAIDDEDESYGEEDYQKDVAEIQAVRRAQLEEAEKKLSRKSGIEQASSAESSENGNEGFSPHEDLVKIEPPDQESDTEDDDGVESPVIRERAEFGGPEDELDSDELDSDEIEEEGVAAPEDQEFKGRA
ncbi:MAG: Rne/Rng family ribonuclease [Bradymonadales bacterium]|nr:MAG: Rne/Rng family ribonuclease [Bradymonadales bacterium]